MSFSLPTASTAAALMGVSSIVSGIGGLVSSRSEEKAGEFNAQIQERRAQAERESQQLLEFKKRKLIKSQISKQVAATSSSGFKFTGDPITIMTESLANAEMDIAIDKYNSEVTARGFQSQAAMERYEAGQRSARKQMAAAQSFFGGAANLYSLTATGKGKEGKDKKLGE